MKQERKKDIKIKMDGAGWWDYAWLCCWASCCYQSNFAICWGGKINSGPTRTNRDMSGGGKRQFPTQNQLFQRAAWPSPARRPLPAPPPPPTPPQMPEQRSTVCDKGSICSVLRSSSITCHHGPPNGRFCCTGRRNLIRRHCAQGNVFLGLEGVIPIINDRMGTEGKWQICSLPEN